MATLDERVAGLESGMTEHVRRVDDVRDAVKHLDDRVDRRFESVDRRFDAVDRRFDAVDGRFNAMDQRLAGMDQKLDAHFVAIDAKMSRIQSLQVGTLLAVIAALAGMLSGITR